MLIERHILVIVSGGVVQVVRSDCLDVSVLVVDLDDHPDIDDTHINAIAGGPGTEYPHEPIWTSLHEDEVEALCAKN